MDSVVVGGVVTRRTWITVVAGALVAAGAGLTPHRVGPYPHPAVPSRVLDRQLDAAIANVLDEAPRGARATLARVAAQHFGRTRRASAAVPRLVQRAVRRMLTRG